MREYVMHIAQRLADTKYICSKLVLVAVVFPSVFARK